MWAPAHSSIAALRMLTKSRILFRNDEDPRYP